MGLAGWEIGLIIAGSIVGAAFLSTAAFYAAFRRLPHWIRNIFRLPPVLSCGPVDTKHQTFDHTRVTGRLFCVSVLPQILIIILLVLAMYEEVPALPVSSWDGMKHVTGCAFALAKEQSIAIAATAAPDTTNELTFPLATKTFEERSEYTDTACGAGAFAAGRDGLSAARAAVRTGDFRGAAQGYGTAWQELRDWGNSAAFDTFAGGDTPIVAELSGFMVSTGFLRDCGVLAAAATTPTGDPTKAHLEVPVEYGTLMRTQRQYDVIGGLFQKCAGDVHPPAVEVFQRLRDDPQLQSVRELALASVFVVQQPSMTWQQRYYLATNTSAMLDSIQESVQRHAEAELKSSYDDLEASRSLLLGLCSFGLVLAVCCIVANVFFIWAHRRSVQGAITIRKDFENAVNNKHIFNDHVAKFERLEVEKFADPPAGLSQVEAAFWGLGGVLLHLKPFLSHSLFEGDLDEHEDHSPDSDFMYAGGRTSQYPVKFEVGMHFCSCTVMVICAEMFNDLSREFLTKAAWRVAHDFNEFIRIVTAAVSFYGGVVHSVGGGSVVCTWNCSLSCDRTQERALDAAFKLDYDFNEANMVGRDDGFRFIPDDEQLQIAICSGDIMAGIIKTLNSKRYVLIGPAPLLAERIVHMCPFHCVPVLIDQETQRKVQDRWFTRPVYRMRNKEGEQIVYEVQEAKAPGRDERLRDYKEAFMIYKKDKRDEAIQAFETYLQNIREEKYGRGAEATRPDASAQVILDRLKLEKRREEQLQRREAFGSMGAGGALM